MIYFDIVILKGILDIFDSENVSILLRLESNVETCLGIWSRPTVIVSGKNVNLLSPGSEVDGRV